MPDTDLRGSVEPHGRRSEDKLRPWVAASLAICVICAVISAVVSVTTSINRRDISTVQSVTDAIQQERIAVSVKNCEAQNARHDATVKRLDRRIADLPPHQRARAVLNRDFTVALIDQLQPEVPDCRAVAQGNVRAGNG